MVNKSLLEDAEEDVRKFLNEEGIDKYDLEIQGQSEAGENYLGEIIFFRITTPNKDKNYDLVVKTAKRNEILREKAVVAYNRELHVYSQIFPTYRKFLKENNPNMKFDFVPKVYWINHDIRRETLIFENLKSVGFQLHDRSKPWDLEHSMLVMEKYGQLHGISFALSKKKPAVFKKLTENMSNIFDDFVKDIDVKEFYGKPLNEAFEILKEAGRHDLVAKFDGIIDEIPKILKNEPEEKDRIVITHGDCWNNNFLFKYENDGTLSQMVFLDFQLTNIHSPVSDLCYNIYATCDKNCLDHFDLLMKTYYNSLSKTVEDLGCESSELLTFDQFMEHWKKYSKIALLIAPTILKFALMSKEDAPNLNDITDTKFEGFFDKLVVKNDEEYKRRIKDVFTHYAENFL